MASQKVMAFFMHETEEKAIKDVINLEQETESFAIGEMDDRDIKELNNLGILIQVLNFDDPDDVDDEPLLKGISIPSFRYSILEKTKGANDENGFPGFYIFNMAMPLLENFRDQLSNIGIKITEYIPIDTYIVKINDIYQHANLSSLDFIKGIRYYGADYTDIILDPASTTLPERGPDKRMLTFDVLLHSETEIDRILEWLRSNNVPIAGFDGNKIRIYLMEDDNNMKGLIRNLVSVKAIEEYIKPHLHNDKARAILQVDNVVFSNFPQLTGEGEIVGVADTGVDDTHPDLVNSFFQQPTAWGRQNNYSDTQGHGTHVAGSIAGTGKASNGNIKGMAPDAKIFFQSLLDHKDELNLPLQLSTLFNEAYLAGARIHNNSWGSSTASRYTVNSNEVDSYVWQNKDMLLVFSAGNDGQVINLPANVDLSYPELLSIGSPASAKNVLTVGASRSDRTGRVGYVSFSYNSIWPSNFPIPPYGSETISGDSQSLAAFSSRGPCDDERIKPDIVAPGTDIASTKSSAAPAFNYWGLHPQFPDHYAFLGGTSMAAPIVSGMAALVRQYLRVHLGHLPSAALLKAVMINGASHLSGKDANMVSPYYNQGFGMIDLMNIIPNDSNKFFLDFFDSYDKKGLQFTRTGQKIRFELTLPTDSWIKATLCYTDYPGNALQNNLNLLMDHPNAQQKWVGNMKIPSMLKKLDSRNNVECINLEKASCGTYSIQVIASNLIHIPQDLALVITCGDPAASLVQQ